MNMAFDKGLGLRGVDLSQYEFKFRDWYPARETRQEFFEAAMIAFSLFLRDVRIAAKIETPFNCEDDKPLYDRLDQSLFEYALKIKKKLN